MPQWDEERQDWVTTSRPAGPAPDTRTRRTVTLAVTVVVLVAAGVVGLWQLARDDGTGSPGGDEFPTVAPSGSWPGWSGTPTDSYSPGYSYSPSDSYSPTDWYSPSYSYTPSSYSTPGASGLGSAADPCAAVDASAASAWGLSSGHPQDPNAQTAGLRSCSWSRTLASGGSVTYTLLYTRDIPVSPEPTPTTIAGLPSASVTGNNRGCVVLWRTSFGKAMVHTNSSDDTETDFCGTAANFAAAVAPRVPS